MKPQAMHHTPKGIRVPKACARSNPSAWACPSPEGQAKGIRVPNVIRVRDLSRNPNSIPIHTRDPIHARPRINPGSAAPEGASLRLGGGATLGGAIDYPDCDLTPPRGVSRL